MFAERSFTSYYTHFN
uniref:UORF2 n=1 Tax=Caenorhabditis elegans TaxID=6239 RepID=Q6SLH8_CAEEL|nr:uORF2 [Caenorhabditis elegans]